MPQTFRWRFDRAADSILENTCHHSHWCSHGGTLCYVAEDINNQPMWAGCIGCGGTHPDGVKQVPCDNPDG